jgi:hypothetical protein
VFQIRHYVLPAWNSFPICGVRIFEYRRAKEWRAEESGWYGLLLMRVTRAICGMSRVEVNLKLEPTQVRKLNLNRFIITGGAATLLYRMARPSPFYRKLLEQLSDLARSLGCGRTDEHGSIADQFELHIPDSWGLQGARHTNLN